MFTGIVEEVGEVATVRENGDSAVLTVRAQTVAEDVQRGASIAVNGVCLTVTGWQQHDEDADGGTDIRFDVMAETLQRSGLASVGPGDAVNLERAVRADARLGGHVVQGHVDGTGVVVSRTVGDAWDAVRFALPAELARYVAEKGSIAVDGVSLTVTAVGADWFEVGLIPETLRATTLGARRPGDRVNIEVDVLAKYVARLTETRS
jgi:riboflavin synthase